MPNEPKQLPSTAVQALKELLGEDEYRIMPATGQGRQTIKIQPVQVKPKALDYWKLVGSGLKPLVDSDIFDKANKVK